jgi:hypothetical protein
MGGKAKFWWPMVAVIVMAVLTGFQDAFTDQQVTAQEWVQVGIGLVMAINVWATANLPGYETMKTLVAAVILTLQALHTFIVGGVDAPELINLAITFLAAIGVAVAKQPVTTTTNGRTVTPEERSA